MESRGPATEALLLDVATDVAVGCLSAARGGSWRRPPGCKVMPAACIIKGVSAACIIKGVSPRHDHRRAERGGHARRATGIPQEGSFASRVQRRVQTSRRRPAFTEHHDLHSSFSLEDGYLFKPSRHLGMQCVAL